MHAESNNNWLNKCKIYKTTGKKTFGREHKHKHYQQLKHNLVARPFLMFRTVTS